jgi:hypothetical protein
MTTLIFMRECLLREEWAHEDPVQGESSKDAGKGRTLAARVRRVSAI